MKKVLIALDYDSNSDHIAKIGYKFASGIGAKTILLHIIEDQQTYAPMLYDPIMGSAGGFNYNVIAGSTDSEGFLDAGKHYLEKIKHHLKDESIETLVKIGDASEEILVNAIHLKVDLIVMGTHSKKWLEKILMGSVAESVLDESEIPLLIIPAKKDK